MSKRRNYLFLLTALIAVLFNYQLNAEDSKDSERDLNFSLPIYIGLSTPNDNISQIYNTDNIQNDIYTQIIDAASLGWHIGAKAVLGFNKDYAFTFGLFYHTFPNSKISVIDPSTEQTLGTITTDQTLYSIDAGLHWYILNAALKLYGIGSLQYNIMHYGLDYVPNDPNNNPIPTAPNDNRVGLGVGAGLDFNLILFHGLLEAKYNFINIIGKSTSEEESKNYFSLSLGIVL